MPCETHMDFNLHLPARLCLANLFTPSATRQSFLKLVIAQGSASSRQCGHLNLFTNPIRSVSKYRVHSRTCHSRYPSKPTENTHVSVLYPFQTSIAPSPPSPRFPFPSPFCAFSSSPLAVYGHGRENAENTGKIHASGRRRQTIQPAAAAAAAETVRQDGRRPGGSLSPLPVPAPAPAVVRELPVGRHAVADAVESASPWVVNIVSGSGMSAGEENPTSPPRAGFQCVDGGAWRTAGAGSGLAMVLLCG